ncbi:hypothetical protein AJ80_07665 [Polytolypa hystricis UAMH7299]|uniref:Uncharacterized protein n=1 Tax=Polytolypa hystricis (strain UAMH7299) TaxID=1447883 RepID=A0A2B7XKF4_POLH7|nr:hypothetical protein AJ80_07665 [Polytolypa hystricis UAMH7299]
MRSLGNVGKTEEFDFDSAQRRTPTSRTASLRGDQSSFIADLILAHSDPVNYFISQPVLVLQVGFELERSMTVWLNTCPELQLGLMVKIQEKKPIFFKNRSPTNEEADIVMKSLMENPRDIPGKTDIHFRDPADSHSPLMIYNFEWVGEVSAFAEVWTRDLDSGEPKPREKKRVISFPMFF